MENVEGVRGTNNNHQKGCWNCAEMGKTHKKLRKQERKEEGTKRIGEEDENHASSPRKHSRRDAEVSKRWKNEFSKRLFL